MSVFAECRGGSMVRIGEDGRTRRGGVLVVVETRGDGRDCGRGCGSCVVVV